MDAPVLRSTADKSADAFRRYHDEHARLVHDLRAKLRQAALGGPEPGPGGEPAEPHRSGRRTSREAGPVFDAPRSKTPVR